MSVLTRTFIIRGNNEKLFFLEGGKQFEPRKTFILLLRSFMNPQRFYSILLQSCSVDSQGAIRMVHAYLEA